MNLLTSAARAAQVLHGRRMGRGFIARCPVHADRTPSLSLQDGADGRLLVHCFSGCDPLNVLAELRSLGLTAGARRHHPQPTARRSATPPYDRIRNILRRSDPISNTLAEVYLRTRGLAPDLADSEALRFLPPTTAYAPAMVSVVTEIDDASHAVGVQLTRLMEDGTRGDRRFLTGSRIAGAVVRLTSDADVTYDLGVAEGVETAMAVMTAMARAGRMVLPVWSALGAGNLADLPVLHGIERLHIFSDRDGNGTGQRAAETLARRWHDAGREVFIATPEAADFNDKEVA